MIYKFVIAIGNFIYYFGNFIHYFENFSTLLWQYYLLILNNNGHRITFEMIGGNKFYLLPEIILHTYTMICVFIFIRML